MLAKYNIRAVKKEPEITTHRMTQEVLDTSYAWHQKNYNGEQTIKSPIADNKYAQNVTTLYNLMTNISLDCIRKHSMLENAAKAACVVLWNQ